MRGGIRPGAGRKPAKIDLGELEKLCGLQCSDQEIAAWFGVSERTIEQRRKQPQFAEVMRRGKAKGRISVRRAQMKLLEAGSGAMGVWMGKQVLGQRDVTPIELSGLSGEAAQFSVEAIDELLATARKATKARAATAPRVRNGRGHEHDR